MGRGEGGRTVAATRGGGPGKDGSGGAAGMPSPVSPRAPVELTDVREEVDEAVESFPGGTTGGCMGSGTRVLLPRVPADCVADLIPFRARVPVRESWVLWSFMP